MAYRVEGKDIIIDGWEKGIAANPFDGISDMREVNISTTEKTVSQGFPLTAATISGTAPDRLVARTTKIVSGSASAYYMCDRDGRVYEASSLDGTWTYLSSSNTTTADSTSLGLAYYKGYLFKFQDGSIYYWNGSTWSAAWKTIVSGCPHYALVGQDDVVYFANGSGVGSFFEKAGATFDPTNAATYTIAATGTNSNALAIPSQDLVQCLAEQGVSLLVGGSQNAIYPWDRISPTFRYPIFVADNHIKRMVTANQNVYIFPGNVTGRGRIYITNGANADLFFKVPDYITGYNEPYFQWGDAVWYRNNLLFSFYAAKNSDGSLISGITDVWAIDLETKAFRGVSHIPSNATGYANAKTIVTDASNSSESGFAYAIGYDDGSSAAGIAYSTTTAGTGLSVECRVQTDTIPVGTFLQKKTFGQVEFKLWRPLQSGESVSIYVETDRQGFTPIGTTTTVGAYSDIYYSNFENAQWLRFRAYLSGNSEIGGVPLREIRIR